MPVMNETGKIKNQICLVDEFNKLWHQVVGKAHREALITTHAEPGDVSFTVVDETHFTEEIKKLLGMLERVSTPKSGRNYIQSKCERLIERTLNDATFKEQLLSAGDPRPLGRFMELFYESFSSDGFSFLKPKLSFTPNQDQPLGFAFWSKSVEQTKVEDLVMRFRLPDFMLLDDVSQLGTFAHECIHNIIHQAAIAVRDNEMDESHPLYETGLFKILELKGTDFNALHIWSAYQAQPEEKVCYANQDLIEAAYHKLKAAGPK